MLDGNWCIKNVFCFLLSGWCLSTAPALAQCEVAKLAASDPEPSTLFGQAVSISTEHVLVGTAYGDGLVVISGTAYVFKREGESWVEQAKLIASDGDHYDHFGSSVGISGEYAVVGARGDDDRADDAGAAYVFKLEGTAWVEEAKLLADDGTYRDYLGRAVVIGGGYVVAGASSHDDAVQDSGSVYVFARQDSGWSQVQELRASDPYSRAFFGGAVAIFGDYLLVGAPGALANGVDGGAAYVFKRESGAWVEQAKIAPSDAAPNKLFGAVVAICEDFALVGAPHDGQGGMFSGAAYLFRREGSTWTEEAKLIASDPEVGDQLGQAVAINGVAAIVGSPQKDYPTLPGGGAAYVFMRDGADWVQQAIIRPTDKEAYDHFGGAISIENGLAIVGARSKSGVELRSGAAYIYRVHPGPDCNSNGMNDACERDCNRNGIPDDCDIDQATSQDLNANGIPDECELAILHVDADATGANSGVGWTDAYTDLQDAIENVLVPGWRVSEIWVAEGTYRAAPPGGVRTATFYLIDGVAMYGGFAGWETQLAQRAPAVNVTILSGDLNGDDGPDSANRGENVYHVLTVLEHGDAPVLDGFTITGGNADEPSYSYSEGGGLRSLGSPTVVDCLFTGNRAREGAGMYTFGSPTLLRCTFSENLAMNDGGGMLITGVRPTLINCTFTRNSADREGGGLYLGSGHGAMLTNCVFQENYAWKGAGIFADEYYSADSMIERCEFVHNMAGNDGGGLYYRSDGSVTVSNCLFSGNSARYGAGAFNHSYASPLAVATSTFTGNVAYSRGGGIFNYYSNHPLVTNCVLWGNQDNSGMVESGQYAYWFGTPNVEYSCIQGLAALSGNGNIGDDPMFVNPGYWDDNGTPWYPDDDVWTDGDYHLLPGSPCIDAGNPDFVPEPESLDMDEEPRVFNDRADMGADEYHDCNGDAVPDYQEIADGSNSDCNGNHILDECEVDFHCLGMDIRPGSCPNPLNRSSRGFLPIAVLGTQDFDVAQIDVSSVVLQRADGGGGEVAPNEGPPGPHSVFEDVATPFEGGGCDCDDLSGDGIDDLFMKFRMDDVVTALELDGLSGGEEIELVVSGMLVGGAAFSTAGDCIVIVP